MIFHKNNLFKHTIKLTALLLLFGFGLISIVGSFGTSGGSNDSSGTNASPSGNSGGQVPLVGADLLINLDKDVMEFFAFLDWLAGGWKEVDLSQLSSNQIGLDVGDPDGRISFIGLCMPNDKGIRSGFYVDTTVSEFTDGNGNALKEFHCPPMTQLQKTTYPINVTIDTSVFGLPEPVFSNVFFGHKFDSKWSATIFANNNSAQSTYDFDIKDGRSTIGDFFIQSYGFGTNHIHGYRDFDVSKINNIIYTPINVEAVRPVSVDVSSVYNIPGYRGFDLTLNAYYTKALLWSDINHATFTAGKLSADEEDPDDLYIGSIRYDSPTFLGFSSSVTKIRNSSVDSFTFDHIPTQDLDVNVTNNGIDPVGFDILPYLDITVDTTELLREAKISNGPSNTRWTYFKTAGAFSNQWNFPSSVPGFNDQNRPIGSTRVTYSSYYAPESSKDAAYRYAFGDLNENPIVNNLDLVRVQKNFNKTPKPSNFFLEIENEKPDYFAWSNYESGKWKQVGLSQLLTNKIDFYVKDPMGRFSMLWVCPENDMGQRRVNYIDTTLADYADGSGNAIDKIQCNKITTKFPYHITGNIDVTPYNPEVFTTYMAFGNNFRSNWQHVLGTGVVPYDYMAEITDGKPTTGDFLFQSLGFGAYHYHVERGIDLSLSPMKSYTPVAADSENNDVVMTVDPSIFGLPGYQGMGLRLNMFNTKAQLLADYTTTDSLTADKLPPHEQDPNDMYSGSIRYVSPTIAGFTFSSSMTQLRHDPTSYNFTQIQTEVPDLTVDNDGTNPASITINSAYSDIPTGMAEMLRRVQISNIGNTNSVPEYQWTLIQTSGTLSNIMDIPSGIPGFDFKLLPTGATKVSYTSKYAAETDKERFYRFLFNSLISKPDVDGLKYSRVNIQYNF